MGDNTQNILQGAGTDHNYMTDIFYALQFVGSESVKVIGGIPGIIIANALIALMAAGVRKARNRVKTTKKEKKVITPFTKSLEGRIDLADDCDSSDIEMALESDEENEYVSPITPPVIMPVVIKTYEGEKVVDSRVEYASESNANVPLALTLRPKQIPKQDPPLPSRPIEQLKPRKVSPNRWIDFDTDRINQKQIILYKTTKSQKDYEQNYEKVDSSLKKIFTEQSDKYYCDTKF